MKLTRILRSGVNFIEFDFIVSVDRESATKLTETEIKPDN